MRAKDILPDEINSSTIGGVDVRKGTVAAFLANARVFLDAAAPADQRSEAESHMIEAIPALDALGVFEVFHIADPRLRAFVKKHRRAAALE